ncbi:MAG: VOC family protein [Propionibacteriales bacterium]|nr:VOC family protein [Propionibacteriales bacterium]
MITPRIRQIVLDTPDPRASAEFYRQLYDLRYRPGDEPPTDGSPDERGADWLVLSPASTDGIGMAFQEVDALPRSTWPDQSVPQMLHLDTSVPDTESLLAVRERALALGATELFDRSDDPDEPLYVFADPAGHPLCIFVAKD